MTQPDLFGPSTGPAGGPLLIPLAEAEPLKLWRGWLRDSPGWLEALTHSIPWEDHILGTPGGKVPAPRRECWFANSAGVPYTYSGETYLSRSIAEVQGLHGLREDVERATGETFDALFTNLYRSGKDSIGWHADAEVNALGPLPEIVIASLSLGARRIFAVRHRRNTAEEVRVELGEGDLLLMGRGVQSHYLHQAPKTARAVGPRLNLTFRRLVGRGSR